MELPWMDLESEIKDSVRAWRAAVQVACVVNVSYRNDLVDSDFVHIRVDARARSHTVNMMGCSPYALYGAAAIRWPSRTWSLCSYAESIHSIWAAAIR